MESSLRLLINWLPRKLKTGSKRSPVKIMVKLVVLGAGGVGKTNIIRRYIHNEFQQEHEPTIEDVYEKHFSSKKRKESILFYIYDTAGSDQFPAMKRLAISKGQLFVVVYAVDDRFEEARKICTEIFDLKGEVKSIVMVGNKCDVPSSQQTVSTEEASLAARQMNCKFMECSAKLGINMDKIFRESVTSV